MTARLSIRDMRAGIVAAELLANPGAVTRVEDIRASIPRLQHWSDEVLGTAIADLVCSQFLEEGPDGRLIVNAECRP